MYLLCSKIATVWFLERARGREGDKEEEDEEKESER